MLEKIWLMVEPYMVSLIAESINSCLTMIALVFMPIVFWRAISFCEKTWNVDLHVAKVFVGICDLLIIVGFVGHGCGL
jgi:hypothetical protein